MWRWNELYCSRIVSIWCAWIFETMFDCVFLYSSHKWISTCKTNARKPCMLEGTITAFKKVFYCSIWTVFNWENPLLRLIQIGDPTKYIFTLLLIVSLTIGWVVAAIVIKTDQPQTDEEKFWDRFGPFFGPLLGPGCLISLIVIIFLYLQRRSVCSTHITGSILRKLAIIMFGRKISNEFANCTVEYTELIA